MQKDFIALELPKILEKLSEMTACEDAREKALSLLPSSDIFEVNESLAKTETAHILIAKFGSPSFGGLINVDNALRRAGAGGCLSMRELLDIAQVLRVIRNILTWREKSASVEGALDDYFNSLYANKYLEDKITGAIISDGEMSDNASTELKNIRRKMRQQESKIRDELDKMLRSAHYKNSLQEAIITQRNGRFVVPVKSEHRQDVAGMVHDTSSSGATVFIEPAGVVDANNEIKVLESKERDEIERILFELSAEASEFADTIIASYNSAVELNLAFSKAKLAYEMKAIKPVMNDYGEIDLKAARHPLLPQSAVVPIDVRLGNEFDTLVITGPNTGGKTVSIKTIGLLTLMAECGLFVPCKENSILSVFENVLCDIGEEQSIEQSLSTFSAHMTKIVEITNIVNDKTLVLIDELGAGTDPVEGAALAVSILEYLRQHGARIAATTHYSELKEYALRTARVENASCEFDVESLRPTYKLLIGIPGRSNAFAISARLNLPESIIDDAQNLISAENTRFEDVVDTLEKTRLQMEQERAQTAEMQAEIDRIKQSAERKLEDAQKKSEKEFEMAKYEAKKIVENARRAANSLMLEIDMLKNEQQKEKNAAELARKARAAMRQKLNDIDDITSDEFSVDDDEDYVLPRPLKQGDRVRVVSLGTEAEVISVNGDSVEVQAGIMKTKTDISDLRLLGEKKSNTQKNKPRTVRTKAESVPQTAKTSVDLRGMDREEAIMELDRYIDSALRLGLNEFTVIHGKGTGVLRKAVQQHLKSHPNVKSHRLGVFGEGEDGVTIVELK
ncbi:MAG TPA: endonuclease MutS2 [Ruminococcaceae bacterium]|nr:endonuclease MutS2 [Oscillospiraceae bacterium]